MARLYIPEPKIDLYKDGFDKHDKLGRKATGDKLSDLVERIDDPLVIALDGAWGSGKSVFLKCWVGEHFNRKGNTTQTVYFDAFQHDYLDDPLIALTSAISERFETKEEVESAERTEKIRKVKKAAWAVSKGAARIGLSALTFGATEVLGNMGDEIAKATGEEAKAFLSSSKGDEESEAYWQTQRSKIAAMEAFRLALTELTAPLSEEDVKTLLSKREEDDTTPLPRVGDPTQKLVIVIDELDRCRPDYALSVLEIIKHFFNVDGVHFVLGVNSKELQNSVRARYGSGVNAAKYLQKFVSIEMPLKNGPGIDIGPSDYIRHFGEIAEETGANDSFFFQSVHDHLRMANHHFTITLRDVEKIAVLIALIPSQQPHSTGERLLIAGCIVLKIVVPELLDKARRGDLEFSDVDNAFLLESHKHSDSYLSDIRIAWLFATRRDATKYLSDREQTASERLFLEKDGRETLRLVIANWLDGFEINSL